ncbi:transmembrane protein 98 isoform 1-T1 [Molossus nigricans]
MQPRSPPPTAPPGAWPCRGTYLDSLGQPSSFPACPAPRSRLRVPRPDFAIGGGPAAGAPRNVSCSLCLSLLTRPALLCVFQASAQAGPVTGSEGAAGSMETVVIVAIGVLATIFLASFAALVVVCRQRYCRPRDLLQRYDSKPIVDLIGAMETQSEPSELELDDVVITNPHIEAILENGDWIEDASGLMSHCIAILKICHTLTEKLVAMTMGSGAKMKTSASVSDIIVVAKRISPRVDDVVKSMYPPLDPKLLDARTTALLLSVSHLVLVTRNACHLTGGLDWVDQSLSAAEEHLEVLREAALASEPEKGLPGPEGFLQEQSAI